MIELYSPGSESELIFLKSILDDAAIRYFVKNDLFGSLAVGPQIELYNRKSIFVHPDDVEDARALVLEFLSKSRAADTAGERRRYSLGDKARMIFEVLLFGWIMPGRRRRRRRAPRLRLVKGYGTGPGRCRQSHDEGGEEAPLEGSA